MSTNHTLPCYIPSPNLIDWKAYGPDRPGKKYVADEEFSFGAVSSESQLIAITSFFGLLLPGILSTLYFLGVPLTEVSYIIIHQPPPTIFFRFI